MGGPSMGIITMVVHGDIITTGPPHCASLLMDLHHTWAHVHCLPVYVHQSRRVTVSYVFSHDYHDFRQAWSELLWWPQSKCAISLICLVLQLLKLLVLELLQWDILLDNQSL